MDDQLLGKENRLDLTMDKPMDLHQVWQQFCTHLDYYGFNYVAYGVLPPSDRNANSRSGFWLSTFPEAWVSGYVEQRVFASDPIMDYWAGPLLTPYLWDFNQKNLSNPDIAKFRTQAADYGMRFGISLKLGWLRGGIKSTLILAFDQMDEEAFQQHLRLNLERVEALAEQFYTTITRPGMLNQLVRLTAREMDCLKGAALGHSSEQIGKILGISKKTAERHLLSASQKLKASTRTNAVAKAIQMRLINP
ncbi:LuxR family transcriptional regulator [Rhodobacteraceae bacterium RKSG542]|uniref:LuxR family transcriptional regulator n=1 Tax=Pseudovibrio flavus TaxID=2529854 RepID=UPI0012BBA7FE|nr:LuxR family transcriptional regulator [Pseudovibrio flavus]MTI18627.1 LuxR family transcriptional regulator [Pseudovibrio flavus]